MTVSTTNISYYTEGPAVDRDGNIFFTAPGGGLIFKIDASGNLSEWAKSPWPNGQIILINGDHLICDSKLGVVRRFNKYGYWIREETALDCSEGKISTPNDLALDPEGNLYFTDSIRHEGKLWCKKNNEQLIIAAGLDYPNGIAVSSSRQCIYVAESYRNRILKISMQAPHEIGVFAELPSHAAGRSENNLPDGIALDRNENLWVAHYGMAAVHKLDACGKILQTIPTDLPLTSNVYVTEDGLVVITGGYAEPGPGAVITCIINV